MIELLNELLSGIHNTQLPTDYEQKRADNYNSTQGTLEGYDCEVCRNKGCIAVLNDDGYMVTRDCKCQNTRKAMKAIEASGLSELMTRYTINNWKIEKQYHRKMLDKAIEFMKNHKGKFFFIGGQVGGGKSHICAAITGELLKSGICALYFMWESERKRLKPLINDANGAYEKAMKPLLTVPVLYIDDFLKVRQGAVTTDADINLAFEIINHRYNSTSLSTIISSELEIEQIMDLDEALGSRILERSKEFMLRIPKSREYNWRLTH